MDSILWNAGLLINREVVTWSAQLLLQLLSDGFKFKRGNTNASVNICSGCRHVLAQKKV